MCGEQAITPSSIGAQPGSPPRVRGTEPDGDRPKRPERITPACAGNSINLLSRLYVNQDHPRVCGEQKGSPSWPYTYMGSPPRVRGTVGGIGKIPLQEGITPACAGNSPLYEKDLPRSRDHPRVCGEQAAYLLEELGRKGSPPRVRGTDTSIYDTMTQQRITPACAGNSGLRR